MALKLKYLSVSLSKNLLQYFITIAFFHFPGTSIKTNNLRILLANQ